LSFLATSMSATSLGGALGATGICLGGAVAVAVALAVACVAAASGLPAALGVATALRARSDARFPMLTMSNEPRIEAARAPALSPTLAVTIVPPSRTPVR